MDRTVRLDESGKVLIVTRGTSVDPPKKVVVRDRPLQIESRPWSGLEDMPSLHRFASQKGQGAKKQRLRLLPLFPPLKRRLHQHC